MLLDCQYCVLTCLSDVTYFQFIYIRLSDCLRRIGRLSDWCTVSAVPHIGMSDFSHTLVTMLLLMYRAVKILFSHMIIYPPMHRAVRNSCSHIYEHIYTHTYILRAIRNLRSHMKPHQPTYWSVRIYAHTWAHIGQHARLTKFVCSHMSTYMPSQGYQNGVSHRKTQPPTHRAVRTECFTHEHTILSLFCQVFRYQIVRLNDYY